MTARAPRNNSTEANPAAEETATEGAERYMWAFQQGNRIVLSIPGLRDLKLSIREARTIGKMLIETADEASHNRRQQRAQRQHGTETEDHEKES
jgi:hypothetical protein